MDVVDFPDLTVPLSVKAASVVCPRRLAISSVSLIRAWPFLFVFQYRGVRSPSQSFLSQALRLALEMYQLIGGPTTTRRQATKAAFFLWFEALDYQRCHSSNVSVCQLHPPVMGMLHHRPSGCIQNVSGITGCFVQDQNNEIPVRNRDMI